MSHLGFLTLLSFFFRLAAAPHRSRRPIASSSPDLLCLPAVHSFFALFTLSPKSIWELFCNQQDPHFFFKTAGCTGFLPILEWGYKDGRSPRICARVAPCVLLAFSRKDRARRQPSRKFDARAEQQLRGGRRRPPASSSQREAELPGNRERREDGAWREARSPVRRLA